MTMGDSRFGAIWGRLRLVVRNCGGDTFCLNAIQFEIVDEDSAFESNDVYGTSCDVGT
jgi:hypothetical protein